MHTQNFCYQRDDIIQDDESLYTVKVHVYSDVIEEAYLAAAYARMYDANVNAHCYEKLYKYFTNKQTILYMEKR